MYFTTINNKEKAFSLWEQNNNTELRPQRSQEPEASCPLSQGRKVESSGEEEPLRELGVSGWVDRSDPAWKSYQMQKGFCYEKRKSQTSMWFRDYRGEEPARERCGGGGGGG